MSSSYPQHDTIKNQPPGNDSILEDQNDRSKNLNQEKNDQKDNIKQDLQTQEDDQNNIKQEKAEAGILEESKPNNPTVSDEEQLYKLGFLKRNANRILSKSFRLTPKSQLVRCPSCERILPVDALVSKCGACGAIIQQGGATARNFGEEWLVISIGLVLESLSALFEQLAYSIMAVVMAFMGFFVCLVETILKARTEQVTMKWRASLPWFYSHHPNNKPFGSTIQLFGLVAGIWQCFHSALGYFYARKHLQNPIKMTVTMIIFSICLLVSKLIKKYSSVPPPRKDEP